MIGFGSGSAQIGAIIIFALTILLVSSAHAFPLHGGNGVVNATVYGVMEYEYGDGIYIDVSASDTDVYRVELVDSNNITYNDNSGPYRSTLHGFPTETVSDGAVRDMLLFKVPEGTVVERLNIIPSGSAPFIVNWTDLPEATSDNTTLRFYGATFKSNGMRWRQGNWNFDVNLTNEANQTVEYNVSDFAMQDQFGWIYKGEKANRAMTIPPDGSQRFDVVVPFVSEISRPTTIIYKNIKLDISSWA